MKALTALLFILAALPASAQEAKHCVVDIRGNQVCGIRADQCILDRYKAAWCAPANGTASKDRYDEVVCGVGACLRDVRGELLCAAEAGGATVTDVSGTTTCAGGCVPASQSACRLMTPK
jgi:hypothetical protein